jgi:crotonobetainyl-CoA:carnitine CoA-transferase CaiB-like acyl-CoA transferase
LAVTDYKQRAEQIVGTSIVGLATACRAASGVLKAVESYLETGDDENVDKAPLNASSKVAPKSLDAKDLSNLASALADSASVLLRLFDK